MKLVDIKKSLEYKLQGAKKIPSDDILSDMFVEAMLYIANKSVPQKLLRRGESEDRVYRNIELGHFIAYPDKPNFADENEHLMIDEPLTYSAINLVAFYITEKPMYIQLANEIIGEFNGNSGKEYF